MNNHSWQFLRTYIIIKFDFYSQVTWRVLQLTKKKAAIERKSVMILDMKACHDRQGEKQERRVNLRRTRSQSDIPRNALCNRL